MSASRKLTGFSTSLHMLVVYTYPRFRPKHTIDLATIPLNEFAQTVQDIVDHQGSFLLFAGDLGDTDEPARTGIGFEGGGEPLDLP
jgi:hypothetical protein